MEIWLRFGGFFGIFMLMAMAEYFWPLRTLSSTRKRRWPINLGLAVLSILVIRVSVGAAAWQAATWAAENQIGLFNLTPIPTRLNIALSLLLLDLAIYAQHIAAHRWLWFWRLHQVHHSDLDFDTTTAVRFHPFEIMLSMLYKVAMALLLGVDPNGIIAFEIILNGCALFNHGNIGLPNTWERRLRYLIVTPNMHRIHHSALTKETDSNYGFSLSCWDRLFKTYTADAKLPQVDMTIGLHEFRDQAELSFFQLLIMPFRLLRKR